MVSEHEENDLANDIRLVFKDDIKGLLRDLLLGITNGVLGIFLWCPLFLFAKIRSFLKG